ncbi:glucose and ribitol dehydrogenase-like [Cynara cardunculus var. scolymus]|uniref:glucose and ribitol dehydrogenase-like n=1 Tax=Cynara cardunculus var. scolymus TaxID=59895 RepID=UPI000D627CA7|nr:glucose and ribitol dehydrogenase-like [Cynara cardunculus var. scolymus]
MMYSIASGIGGIPITEKSCMSSQRLLATRGTLRISSYGVVMNIGSLVVRRRCSAFPTLKVKAIGKEDQKEDRFPPQHQETQPGKEYLMNPRPQFSNPNYNPSDKLRGKVALVTGGDSGIGRAICYAFAKEGATIAFTYVKGDEDIDAADTLKIIKEAKTSESSDPTAIPTDLRYNQNCQDVVDDVIAKYGHIDVLINNPAVQYPLYSLEDITEERLEKVFRTNIFSYFFMTRHAIKHMKQGSSIINTASLVAYIGNGKFLDYGSTKGAVVSFTRGLSQFLLDKGIRVNGVAPGPVWTPLEVSGQDDEEIVIFGSQVPMDRAAQPYEMAPSYVFLASEDSSYFTGQVLHPNGGVIVNA